MNNTLLQHSLYIGNAFNGILYGVQLVLYYLTMQIYLKRSGQPQSHPMFYMIFSTVQLFLVTVFVATQGVIGEEMWIVHSDYPGGPAAYFAAHVSDWYQSFGSVASTLRQLMSDGLLIHRCFTVWGGSYWITLIPALLWFCTLIFGTFQNVVSFMPGGNFFAGRDSSVGLVYFSTTISLNIVTTALICGRIFYHGKSLERQFGPNFSKTYFDVASIVIESALPYTLIGIAFLISYGMRSGISIFFLSLYALFTCISPQILILRVARGRAWTKQMAEHPRMTQSANRTLVSASIVSRHKPQEAMSKIHFQDISLTQWGDSHNGACSEA